MGKVGGLRMMTITEEEWRALPSIHKRVTPLTKLKQCRFINKDNPEGTWITFGINFIIGGRRDAQKS
jgi:hypothetical protein